MVFQLLSPYGVWTFLWRLSRAKMLKCDRISNYMHKLHGEWRLLDFKCVFFVEKINKTLKVNSLNLAVN